ncbi:MAG: polysaccharide biosynthesis/export family protein [Bacteroidaceae bacterium]
MNKQTFLLLLGITLLSFSSCVSNKEMTYIQGVDAIYATPKEIQKDYGLVIQPDDQLAISVNSKDVELLKPFNNLTLIGGGSTGMGGGNTINTTSGISYFYVDKNGVIDFPIFGKMKVGGKTVNEVSDQIQKQMMNEGHIKDVTVSTKIMSFKVTVLGDVRNPGTQSYTGERLTLLEALGRAGDLNSSAIRTKVLVIREENSKRVSYKVDLTIPESVFKSPAYYMQQNDLVYVESNKSVKVKGSTSYTYLSVSGTLVGIAASITSLIIALSK